MQAIANLEGKYVHGDVIFIEDLKNKDTVIKISIKGLKPGKHGFHIHEKADLRKGCSSLGPHYNPFHKNHGGLNSKERHVGDLGNVVADKNGDVNMTIRDKLIKLRGKYSVVGRSIIVHEDVDDLGKGGYEDSLTTGHSGKRIACGIIGYL